MCSKSQQAAGYEPILRNQSGFSVVRRAFCIGKITVKTFRSLVDLPNVVTKKFFAVIFVVAQ